MKKSDLKTGMRVITYNGNTYVVMLNSTNSEDVLVGVDSFTLLSNYDDNLITDYSITELDIMKIYSQPEYYSDLLDFKVKGDLLWERKENNYINDRYYWVKFKNIDGYRPARWDAPKLGFYMFFGGFFSLNSIEIENIISQPIDEPNITSH